MTIKLGRDKYKVCFCDMLEIRRYQLLLFLKRQKRRLKLLFNKEQIMPSLIITGMWVLFGIATILYGNYFSSNNQSPYGISEIIWELFASVVIVYVIGSVERIKTYCNKIRVQHDIYVTAMHDFGGLIEKLAGDSRNPYFALYCDKCLNDTIDHVSDQCLSVMSMNEEYRLLLTLIRDRLDRVEQEFISGNIVQYRNNDWILYSFNGARMLVNKMLLSDKLLTKDVVELSQDLKQIVDCLREPWRVDLKIKTRILKILDKEPDNNIKDEFYHRMLLWGPEFDAKTGRTIVKVRRKR